MLAHLALSSVGSFKRHKPSFYSNEWHYFKKYFGFLFFSSMDKSFDSFELDLDHFTDVKKATALIRCYQALLELVSELFQSYFWLRTLLLDSGDVNQHDVNVTDITTAK